MIRIHDIKLPAVPPEEEKKKLEEVLGGLFGRVPPYRIVRHSLDARKKPEIYSVYSVDAETAGPKEEERLLKRRTGLKLTRETPLCYREPVYKGTEKPAVAVIGAGPAGLFAALSLARAGLNPLLIEQGAPVEERTRQVESFWNGGELLPYSNVQCGEGGAGAFSDGKLATGIRDKEGRIGYILQEFVKAGAPEKIAYEAKPHVGTDGLYRVVQGLRAAILKAGGTVRYYTRFTELILTDGRVTGLRVADSRTGAEEMLPADCVILAPGHSARETFRRLREQGAQMEPKGFAMGLRIQHRQSDINVMQYGEGAADFLPVADYKLTAHTSGGRGVYSFCMCPGGSVVNASDRPGALCVNGMSDAARDGENANSALVVEVSPADYAADGLFGGAALQEAFEQAMYRAADGKLPIQRWEDFAAGRRTEAAGKVSPQVRGNWTFAELRECVPDWMAEALLEAMPQFDRRMRGFADADALLTGAESRTSSPIRLLRNEAGESNIKGLYPCGEGAGYAGGITSAAVDGLKAAEAVIAFLNGQ